MSQRPQRRTQKGLSQRSQRAEPQPGPSSQANGTQYEEDDSMVNGSQIDSSLSEQEHNQYVANVVKYILAADQSKVPIPRATLNKCAGCPGGKNFRSIMKSAEEMLQDTFGYKVIDVDGKIILLNEISEISELRYSEDIELRHSLLFLVLSHIFMNGEACSETSLMNFLSRANIIIEGNVKHADFGNVVDIINNDFVKEKYLDVTKPDGEGKEKEYKWGKRSEKELPVRAVMQFASLVYGRRGIDSWPQQFNAMREMEQRTGTLLLIDQDNEEEEEAEENGTQHVMEVEDD